MQVKPLAGPLDFVYDEPLQPDEAGSVVLHPLFLLAPRSLDHASLRRAADVSLRVPPPRRFSRKAAHRAFRDEGARIDDARLHNGDARTTTRRTRASEVQGSQHPQRSGFQPLRPADTEDPLVPSP
jgi:hypothetical protein